MTQQERQAVERARLDALGRERPVQCIRCLWKGDISVCQIEKLWSGGILTICPCCEHGGYLLACEP